MRFTRLALVLALLLISLSSFVTSNAQEVGPKLQEILDRGQLNCGISGGLPGFSAANADSGRMEGLDADYCRAVAAAIFGDAANVDNYVNFVPLTANDRFTALQAGEVDVLMRNTTWTLTRDASLNSNFGPTTFYDGQGLLVPVALGVTTLADLEGAKFCTQSGTTTEKNIVDAYTAMFGAAPELVLAETSDATLRDLESGACDALTSDKSQLAGLRSAAADPSAYVLLADTLSKEPLGPMYLDDDTQFGDIVDWAVYATFTAEELGVTSANVEEILAADNSANPVLAGFLGQTDANLGSLLGLSNDFAVNVIRAVGNYGEIYERNVVPIGIDREGTLNATWLNGGLIYAPAWR